MALHSWLLQRKQHLHASSSLDSNMSWPFATATNLVTRSDNHTALLPFHFEMCYDDTLGTTATGPIPPYLHTWYQSTSVCFETIKTADSSAMHMVSSLPQYWRLGEVVSGLFGDGLEDLQYGHPHKLVYRPIFTKVRVLFVDTVTDSCCKIIIHLVNVEDIWAITIWGHIDTERQYHTIQA